MVRFQFLYLTPKTLYLTYLPHLMTFSATPK